MTQGGTIFENDKNYLTTKKNFQPTDYAFIKTLNPQELNLLRNEEKKIVLNIIKQEQKKLVFKSILGFFIYFTLLLTHVLLYFNLRKSYVEKNNSKAPHAFKINIFSLGLKSLLFIALIYGVLNLAKRTTLIGQDFISNHASFNALHTNIAPNNLKSSLSSIKNNSSNTTISHYLDHFTDFFIHQLQKEQIRNEFSILSPFINYITLYKKLSIEMRIGNALLFLFIGYFVYFISKTFVQIPVILRNPLKKDSFSDQISTENCFKNSLMLYTFCMFFYLFLYCEIYTFIGIKNFISYFHPYPAYTSYFPLIDIEKNKDGKYSFFSNDAKFLNYKKKTDTKNFSKLEIIKKNDPDKISQIRRDTLHAKLSPAYLLHFYEMSIAFLNLVIALLVFLLHRFFYRKIKQI